MRKSVVAFKSCVLIILATLPDFGKSSHVTVGEEFKFSCKHDGKSQYSIYPFSNAESFVFSTSYKIMNMKLKVQSFDNGNTIKCTMRAEDGKKLLNTSDVLVVQSNPTGKDEFEASVTQEHVFYENEEYEFACDATLVGWIKVDANNIVTDGDTKNGLITKNFTLKSNQFDGAKLICLNYKCTESVGCEREIQKVVTFRRQPNNLIVGDEFKFGCKYDGKSQYSIYPFSNAESFHFFTSYKIMNIKMKLQSFDNGNTMKCTTRAEDKKEILFTSDVLVVRPNPTGKDEFEPSVKEEHVFYENEEYEFACDATLVGWIKVNAHNVVTDGDTKNGLITKKFTLTSDLFDGAKLICLKYDCSESVGCERQIQKVVTLRRQSTNLNLGDEFKFSCKHDGKTKYNIYPFSSAESFSFHTSYKIMNIKIKAQSFDNGNTIKCTTQSTEGKRLLNTTNVLVVRPNTSVKDEFEVSVSQEYVFHENEDFEFSCNAFLVGWIKVDASNVVTDGDTKNGLITKKFTLTSDQFDGAKLICLEYECSESIGCERKVQKVVTFRHTDPTIYPEGVEPVLGSEEHPSPAICRFYPDITPDVPGPDPYWVMENEKFPVKCDKTTNRTCLILSHDDARWIRDTKFFIGNESEQIFYRKRIWLSRSGFNLDHFNTISQSQLHWLKEQSMNVKQSIRVYLTNTEFAQIQLRMLNAHDVLVGTRLSPVTPMFYTVQQQDEASIIVDGETWSYVDLEIVDTARRLPVIDFFIEQKTMQPGDAYISVQLRELCFG